MNLEFLHAEHALVFCTISQFHDSSSHHPFSGVRLKDETQGLRYARYMTLWRDPLTTRLPSSCLAALLGLLMPLVRHKVLRPVHTVVLLVHLESSKPLCSGESHGWACNPGPIVSSLVASFSSPKKWRHSHLRVWQ